MRDYESCKGMLADFEEFMKGRIVAQWNGESNEAVDKECGCCMGAHLARFFWEEGRQFDYEVHGILNEINLEDYGDITRYVKNIEEWQNKLDAYVANFVVLDEVENYNEDDMIHEWLNNDDSVDTNALHFRDGVSCLHSYLELLDDFYKREVFDSLLAHYARGKGDNSHERYPWSGEDWQVKNHVLPFRQAILATELFEGIVPWANPKDGIHNAMGFVNDVIAGKYDDQLSLAYQAHGLDMNNNNMVQ